jgi:hypothetical protein
LQQVNAALEEKFRKLQDKVTDLQHENKGLQEKASRAEARISGLVHSNEGLLDENQKLRDQVGELQAGLKEAEERAVKEEANKVCYRNYVQEAGKNAAAVRKQLQKGMLPLAVLGANVLALKSTLEQSSWCSFEVVGGGKNGAVRGGMSVDPTSSEIVRTVMKVVDTSRIMDWKTGVFSGLGSAMEPCITTLAAASLASGRAAYEWLAPAGAAGDAKGALLDLVMSMEVRTLPDGNEEEEKLQQHLDQLLPRPPHGFTSSSDEQQWVRERDAAAEQFMEQNGCQTKDFLCMVMREADGGALDQHVLKDSKALHCSTGGVLSFSGFLFLAHLMCLQLAVLHSVGILLRDVKTGNVLLSGGLPFLADLDISICCAVLTWLQKRGLAGPNAIIAPWGGTPGYVVEWVAKSKGKLVRMVDLAQRNQAFQEMVAGDIFGLGSTLLDLLTGKPRYNLVGGEEFTTVSSSRKNVLLEGALIKECRKVPPVIQVYNPTTGCMQEEQLPQDLSDSLSNILRYGATAGERRAALPQLMAALEGAMGQREKLLGMTRAQFMQAQQQELMGYINSS